MSLDVDGFTNVINGGDVIIKIDFNHRLLKLARNLPWESMLQTILPDLKRTEQKHWWMGRPLRLRIHLGVYILQQMFDLSDRAAEQHLNDNAAFRLFCGYGLIKEWHVPDHTKIETFRSRLTAETQRKLANRTFHILNDSHPLLYMGCSSNLLNLLSIQPLVLFFQHISIDQVTDCYFAS